MSPTSSETDYEWVVQNESPLTPNSPMKHQDEQPAMAASDAAHDILNNIIINGVCHLDMEPSSITCHNSSHDLISDNNTTHHNDHAIVDQACGDHADSNSFPTHAAAVPKIATLPPVDLKEVKQSIQKSMDDKWSMRVEALEDLVKMQSDEMERRCV